MARTGTGLKRLEAHTSRSPAQWQVRDREMAERTFAARVLRPILDHLQGMGGAVTSKKERQGLKDLISQAGFPGGITVGTLVAIRFLLMMVFPVIGLILFKVLDNVFKLKMFTLPIVLGLGGMGAAIGYLSLPFIVKIFIKKRRKALQKQLPDVLDLITISVQAGQGLDASIDRVAQRYKGEMGEELQRTMSAVNMGRPFDQALRDMAERTGVPDVHDLAVAIIQAREMGANIADVLRVQAESLRQARAQRAEEQAQKAPTKMMIPLILFIFPTLFIVLIGPAALKAAKTLKDADIGATLKQAGK